MNHKVTKEQNTLASFWNKVRVPLLLVLLAHLLRTYTLDWQSFWIDEVQAFDFINKPLIQAFQHIISPRDNGPLYFLLLWGWHRIAGASDFALRYFSDLCSVLTIATLWKIANAWFGRRAAGWSGLLLAVSPFAIWFGQEAKMYALHMLLTTLATLFLIKAQRHNRWPLWLAYGITINLLAYSHFFGALAIAAQGILTLLTGWKQKYIMRSYLITMALVALPYLPVISFVMRVLPHFQLQDISKGFVSLPNMLRELASDYTLRVSRIQVQHPTRLHLPLASLLMLGLVEAWRRNWKRGLWLSGLLLLPLAIFYPISFKVSVFSPKYLSAMFPFFIITLGMALTALQRLWKPLIWVGLALSIGVAGWANVRTITDPTFQRSDWRTTAAYLEAHAQADDAIVVYADYLHRPIYRYYDGQAPIYRFKANAYYPEDYYQGWLQHDNDHHSLWLVLHQDQAMAPHNRLEEAAGLLYPNITGVYPNNGNIAILGYSLRWRHTTLPDQATPLVEAHFQNGLALVGYQVDATALTPTDKSLHPPSNWLHVTTYWQLWDSAPPLNFEPFIHLVDAQGGIWGGELQRPPTVFHFDPPEQWEPSTIIEAHYDINLNPITPAGSYRLIAGLEDENGEKIPLVHGTTQAYLRDIEITKGEK